MSKAKKSKKAPRAQLNQTALGKMRGYSYILFFILCVMLAHSKLADLFGAGQRHVLLAFVLLAFMQITMCFMFLMQFATSIPEGKEGNLIKMYAARMRISMFTQYGALLVCVLNEYLLGSRVMDIITICVCIIMIYFTLKNLTIVQRGNY